MAQSCRGGICDDASLLPIDMTKRIKRGTKAPCGINTLKSVTKKRMEKKERKGKKRRSLCSGYTVIREAVAAQAAHRLRCNQGNNECREKNSTVAHVLVDKRDENSRGRLASGAPSSPDGCVPVSRRVVAVEDTVRHARLSLPIWRT